MSIPILIDCDPGQDDAVMLLLAFASKELDILGITTVAGNVPLEKTDRNARIMAELGGRRDIAIVPGRSEPLKRRLVTAEYVHGKEGIDGAELFEPSIRPSGNDAIRFLVDTLRSCENDSVTLVPTGPLTNIAVAIQEAPEILEKIRSIVLMGGAYREGGNVTPCAEFNVYVDPHAADIVFRCGRPIVAMSLDVTHQAISTKKRRDAIGEIGNRASRNVKAMLEFYNRYDSEIYGFDGGPLHDPCTIAYLLKPELFVTKDVNVVIETESELTMGQTVVDFWRVTDRPTNTAWATEIDSDGFFELLTEHLAMLD